MITLFLLAIILFCIILFAAPSLFPDIIKNQIEQRIDKMRNDTIQTYNR